MGRRALLVVAAVTLAIPGCALAPGGDGLAGRMVGVDDTGLPDHPLGGGAILAVPADRELDLWAATEPAGVPADWAHAGVRLPRKAVAGLDGAVAGITRSGRFRLDAPAGPAVVCYVGDLAEDGLTLWGCAELELPPGGALRGTWGEGGFAVAID